MVYCEKCKVKTTVKDSVPNETDGELYRMRECRKCHNRFFTVEFEVENNDSLKKRINICRAERRVSRGYGKNKD